MTPTASTIQSTPMPADLAHEIAQETYVWGYPLVLMDLTRRVTTNFAAPTDVVGQAPMNQFSHAKAFPPASFRAVVRPNFDTLYSVAYLDLGPEPLVLTLPQTDRYHVFQMMDGWSEVFAAPGTRTTGGVGGASLIVGPEWQGDVPSGMALLRSPTDIVWIVGRIQTNGAADYDFVHELQKQITLTPLSQWGTNSTPPQGTVDPTVDMETPPMTAVDSMDGETFFTSLMAALKKNAPLVHDQAVVTRMARLGLTPGQDLNLRALPAAVQQALTDAPKPGLDAIRTKSAHLGTLVNGWSVMLGAIGYFGADYAARAAVALAGLGANRPEDAIYPMATTDGDGKPLNGANRYTLTFAKGQTPPVAGFWSLTLYDEDGFPVENPINRQAIGDRDDLTIGDDGSMTLLIQHESPGKDQEANWLPAPAGGFTLAMRCYAPLPPIASGDWAPPPVTKVT